MAPEFDQEFDPGTLHALRAKVLAQACRAGLSEGRAADVVLAVHEGAIFALVKAAVDRGAVEGIRKLTGCGPARTAGRRSPPGRRRAARRRGMACAR